jgi:predicted ArsR family transcriptional regulator
MDELAGVGSPELREALVHARAQDGPVTADELAAALQIHRNVARSRLERLVRAGLLEVAYERRSGRAGPGAGRPAKVYSVVPELVSIEFPTRRYETLIGLLVDALAPEGRVERLRDTGLSFGHHLADAARLRPAKTVRTGFERVCAALRRLGYQASLERVDGDSIVIGTATCPLRPIVRAFPAADQIDRGMWVGLASRAIPGLEASAVTCETNGCLDDQSRCRVVVTFARRQDLR